MTPDAETPLPDPVVVGYDLPRFTGSTDSRPPRTDWGLVAVSIIELRASVATDPDGSIVLNLEGEFDLEAAPLVEDFIESGLATGASRLVLDLGRVSFMDSQAVRALVRAHDTSRVAGAQLVLRSPTERTMDLLLMTGLDLVFTVEDR